MTDKRISELNSAASLSGTELLPVVQSSATVKATAQAVANLAPGRITQGVFASRPAASTTGALYLATDIERLYRDTGSVWQGVSTDSVSVLDYGAKGNGVTDDLAAIQAAVNSGANRIRFPAGTYLLSGSIAPKSNQVWVGDGVGATKLTTSAAGDGSVIFWGLGSGALLTNFTIRDMAVENTGTVNNTVGVIYIRNGAVNFLAENVSFLCTHTAQVINGFRLTFDQSGTQHVILRNCTFDSFGRLATEFWDGVQNGSLRGTDITIQNCRFTNTQDIVLSFGGYISDIKITGCDFVNPIGTGIELVGTNGTTVTGCTWFNATDYCITLSGNIQYPQNCVISGCSFNMGMPQTGTNSAIHTFNGKYILTSGNIFNIPIAVAAIYFQNSTHCSAIGNQITGSIVSITGNISTGSAVVSGITHANTTAATPFYVGMDVIGTGIPNGATIASIQSATQFTLSANSTATATARALSVQGCAGVGVQISGSSYCSVQANRTDGSPITTTSSHGSLGVRVDSGTNNVVMGNSFYHPNDAIAYIDTGTGTSFLNNQCFSLTDQGNVIAFQGSKQTNSLAVSSGIAGAAPVLLAQGSDTNVNVLVQPQGTGSLVVNSPVSGPTFNSWNPNDLASNLRLSNSNLTASGIANIGADFPGRAIKGYTSGKIYWEYTGVSSPGFSNSYGAGIADLTFPFNIFLGQDTHSYAVYNDGIWHNNAKVFSFATTEADVLAIAVDIDNSKIWMRDITTNSGWNNDILANQNPATNTGGLAISGLSGAVYPAYDVARAGSVTLKTTNTGTPPSGFSTLALTAGTVKISPTTLTLTPPSGSAVALVGPLADQSYNKQAPATGFSITIGNSVRSQILDPAGTLATGTIIMPAAPTDGQEVRVSTTQTVTTLTVSPNSGQTIKNAPSTLTAGGTFSYIYVAANTTWYKTE